MATIKHAYIALTHRYSPARQQRGKWEVMEECKFVSDVKYKLLTEASVVVDVLNQRVVKCRADGGDYESLIKYVSEKYANEYNQFCKVVGIEPYVAPVVDSPTEDEATNADIVDSVAEAVTDAVTDAETKSE